MSKFSESLLVVTAPCWNCNENMLVALAGTQADFSYGPADFSESERGLAEKYGVYLKLVSSKTADRTYFANVCKKCGEFVGEFYLFAHYFAPAMYGHYKYEEVKDVN